MVRVQAGALIPIVAHLAQVVRGLHPVFNSSLQVLTTVRSPRLNLDHEGGV
jgi:hypothetical protein